MNAVKATAANGEVRVVTAQQRSQQLASLEYYRQQGCTLVNVYDQAKLDLRVLWPDGTMHWIPSGALLLTEINSLPEARPLMTGGPVVYQGRTYIWQTGQNVYD